ncbi:MAG: PspC domain-containing protein [Candidatus Marinimicrobia bacterium]|jgi:phage shock protein PspC (stress-responsive transcriptional regulator)|nr:PspC domain-containing protein [Candidatus Neomarinimicrobiota bacterium]MBT3634300.1 PspC domain-containing protein [Candidatus Neomarinimicrobiota bacterium]MBT3682901.1 PspC domain-containing protein [Candidatus Neomarinimicrobiota bacterium]MBT3760109.1 PspC domain-containing protein [Candidatus Neomarinimicrobiota bacterium]MBT3896124.1 PspC domain-containing protein [Candidatus Neomarinimicrobiota bacterium]
MNKTETINLGGIIFHIEEDAFAQLQSYITSIKKHFSDTDSAEEIATDIEARIAEILQEKKVSIVTKEHLDEIVKIMGQPEDYGDDESSDEQDDMNFTKKKKIKKRFYRHPEDKLLGGVTTGLGVYFNIDPILIRIAFILTLFLGGFGLLAYLVLWLVVPEADSASDYLKMKGEPITAESIGKTFTSKVENVVSQANGNMLKSFIQTIGNIITFIFEITIKIIKKLLFVLKPILGIVLLLFGLFLTIGSTFLILAFSGRFGVSQEFLIQIHTLNSLYNNFPIHESVIFIAVILFVGIPIFQLIYLGLRFLLGLAKQANFVVGFLTSIWVLALISVVAFTVFGLSQFSEQAQKIETVDLNVIKSDTLNVELNDHPDFFWDDGKVRFRESIEGNQTLISDVSLEIRQSSDNNFHLEFIKKANADNYIRAKEIAEDINYEFDISKESLSLDQYFSYPSYDSYKFQEIELVLYVPEGKSVFLDESLKYYIDDMGSNHSYYQIRYSVGRVWTMRSGGLHKD